MSVIRLYKLKCYLIINNMKEKIKFIEETLFKCCNVKREDVMNKSRKDVKVTYRHGLYYLVKKYTGLTDKEIGDMYDTERSNVCTSIQSIKFRMVEHNSYVIENIRTADNLLYRRFNFTSFLSEFIKEVVEIKEEEDFRKLINKYKNINYYELQN